MGCVQTMLWGVSRDHVYGICPETMFIVGCVLRPCLWGTVVFNHAMTSSFRGRWIFSLWVFNMSINTGLHFESRKLTKGGGRGEGGNQTL